MKEPITKVKRNYGIDMLRLVAMFFCRNMPCIRSWWSNEKCNRV